MSEKEGPKPHELLNLYIKYYLGKKKSVMMNWKFVLEQIHIMR